MVVCLLTMRNHGMQQAASKHILDEIHRILRSSLTASRFSRTARTPPLSSTVRTVQFMATNPRRARIEAQGESVW